MIQQTNSVIGFCFNRHFIPILGMVSSYSVITTLNLVMCPVYVFTTSVYSSANFSPDNSMYARC